MILPQKHITLAESLFGLGGYILSLLETEKTIDMLWDEFVKSVEKGYYPFNHNFDSLILAIEYLFIIDAVEINEGRISKK